MDRDVEDPARVGKQRQDMENRGAHGPEAMRIEREHDRGRRAEEVDREMAGVERREPDRYENVKQRIAPHHRQRYRGHRAFGPTSTPSGIAKRNQQKSQKQRRSHRPSFSCRLPPVNLAQAAAWMRPDGLANAGHS